VASVCVTQQVSAVKTDQVTASTLQGILGIPAMSPGHFSWLGDGTQTPGAALHVTAYPGNAASMLYVESTTANPNQATVQIKDDNWGYKVAYYLNVGEGDQSTGLVDEGGLSGVDLEAFGSNRIHCLYSTTECDFAYFTKFSQPIGLASQTAIASAATITPTAPTFHVTGTTQITTITAFSSCASGTMCQITIIPDGLWTSGTTGNIALASTTVVARR
jgi:hypothetical protein